MMFKHIFYFEVGHWLRQPSTYIFTGFFFAIAMFSMAGTAGAFDPHSEPDELFTWINSPAMIWDVTRKFNMLILVLLPTIIGVSIFRDFKHKMHSILYAYPINKSSFYSAKFTSAFVFMIIILLGLIIGLIAGEFVPTVDPNKVGATNWIGYLQVLFVFLIPNILLVGSIVFVVVTLTRNIYSGFIAATIILLLNFIFSKVMGGLDNQLLGGLFDPLGDLSLRYYTQYWTGEDINTLLLPVKGVVIWNRIIWISISLIVLWFGYKNFELEQHPNQIQLFKLSKNPHSTSKIIPPLASDTAIVSQYNLDFSLIQQLRTMRLLTWTNVRYILGQRSFLVFLVVGLIVIAAALSIMNQQELTAIQPVTWRMLEFPVFFFSAVINILTFLFAGMLIHRHRMAEMNQLVDICPQPNWVFTVSTLSALFVMQLTVLFVIMVTGVAYQLFTGFYDIRIGQALFELFVINFIYFSVYAYLAVFVQSIFKNPFLGLFVLMVLLFAIPQVRRIGLDHILFQYNQYDTDAIGFDYSELSGYGVNIVRYLVYKLYWIILGVFLIIAATLFWIRGIPHSLKERIQIIIERLNMTKAIAMGVTLIIFGSFGYSIYYQEDIAYTKIKDEADQQAWAIQNEKLFGRFRDIPQPIMTNVKLAIDLYNSKKSFDANAVLTFKNHTTHPMDTLVIYSSYDEVTTYTIDRSSASLLYNEEIQAQILRLDHPLMPNDSFQLIAHIQNEPNTWFHSSSGVKSGGTFFNNSFLPEMGYKNFDISDEKIRAENNLSTRELDSDYLMPDHPEARLSSISSFAAPWVQVEATISTDINESAITVGELQRQWTENNRNYFHYKTNRLIKNRYAIQSGKYVITEDKWKDVKLFIYHHPDHTYNLERIFKGAKAALEYGSNNYGPYPHKEVRFVEFPRTEGNYATLLSNTIPFSETRFVADIKEDPDAIDFIFYVTAHELSHQWWGNNLNPANAKGAKLLTEGITEYSTLKILEKEYGIIPVQKFLKYDLDAYLQGRAQSNIDQPLLYADPIHDHINYRKGSIALFAISDYIGERKFNQMLQSFMQKIQYQSSDYATSLDFLGELEGIVPDSLNYLIKDMLETSTFYDIVIEDATARKLDNGKYQVDLSFYVSKKRRDTRGSFIEDDGDMPYTSFSNEEKTIQSLPLQDYIEIGLFDNEENQGLSIYLKKHLITTINNKISIIVDRKPIIAGIDPLGKLIDLDTYDNRMEVK